MMTDAFGGSGLQASFEGLAYLVEGTVLLNPVPLRAACDFIVHDEPVAPATSPPVLAAFLAQLDRVRDGAVIYVKTNLLEGFFAAAFPRLLGRIVLVTAENAWSAPGPYRAFLDDPRLVRWFGQNCDLVAPHPKFEAMPLGFTTPQLPHGNQEAMLRVHRRMPAVVDKPLSAHASFHLTLSHPARAHVRRALFGMPGIVFEPRRLPPELLWVHHAKHAFAASPRGAGRDCHRTWEALLLRTIPIVEQSCLAPVYRGFPVVEVSDWREITVDAMAQWRSELAEGFTAAMFERLTADYWTSRIRRAARSA